MEDNIKATKVKLTDEDLNQLNVVSALPLEYPGWMINLQSADRAKQPEN